MNFLDFGRSQVGFGVPGAFLGYLVHFKKPSVVWGISGEFLGVLGDFQGVPGGILKVPSGIWDILGVAGGF